MHLFLDENCSDPWVKWCIANYQNEIDGFSFNKTACIDVLENGLMGGNVEIEAYKKGEAPWPITYTFLPDELERILYENGVRDIQLAGPGAYARTIPNEILRKIMNDPVQKSAFLDFCHTFDQNPYVCGMGKDNLFAKGVL